MKRQPQATMHLHLTPTLRVIAPIMFSVKKLYSSGVATEW